MNRKMGVFGTWHTKVSNYPTNEEKEKERKGNSIFFNDDFS